MHCQILDTHVKHVLLGTPTSLPPSVVKWHLALVLKDSEQRIREDRMDIYDKSLHTTKVPIVFLLVRKYLT